MAAKRDVWVLPQLRKDAVEPFLVALAPHFALAAQADLRLHLDQSGRLVALYPRPAPDAPLDLGPLRGRLREAFVAAGRTAGETDGPPQSRAFGEEPSLRDGVLAFLWRHAGAADAGDAEGRAGDPSRTLRAVIEQRDGTDPAEAFAGIVRRSRDALVLGSDNGVTLVDLDDDPDRGAMLDALRAAGLPPGTTLLRCLSTAGMKVWLPEGRSFGAEAALTVEKLLNGLAEACLLAPGGDLHFLPDGPDNVRIAWLPAEEGRDVAFRPVEEMAASLAGPAQATDLGPALRFVVQTLRPNAEAQLELNRRLNDRAFPLGYRISLAPIRGLSRSDEDIERLRAEIDEREAQIALIQALGRPQLRLLRFSEAQLPALVDGLRRMPRALRENAGLGYAATHAAGRVGPAHYILYDPDIVQLDGMMPEHYWRAVTEDQPILFWLDPHAEDARDGNPAEPQVFVPNGQRILPYIDSFGSSLSGTLRLVLGSLFADASAVLGAGNARPAFVFSALSEGPDEIGVELVDLARFEPLKLSLRWINDHILASSPRSADAEDLRELAETLYAGQLARTMKSRMKAEVSELIQNWQQARAEILNAVAQLEDALIVEVGDLTGQIRDARRLVDLAQARLAEVSRDLNGLATAVGQVDSGLQEMADSIPGMAADRIAFFDRFESEHRISSRLVEDTEAEVARLRARMQSLAPQGGA